MSPRNETTLHGLLAGDVTRIGNAVWLAIDIVIAAGTQVADVRHTIAIGVACRLTVIGNQIRVAIVVGQLAIVGNTVRLTIQARGFARAIADVARVRNAIRLTVNRIVATWAEVTVVRNAIGVAVRLAIVGDQIGIAIVFGKFAAVGDSIGLTV